MALIVIPRRVPWRRKPRPSAQINFAHPLARGLVADIPILENFGSTVRNLANDALNGTLAGGAYTQTEKGLGLEFSSTTHGVSFNGKTDFRLATWTHHIWLIPKETPGGSGITRLYDNDLNFTFSWDHTSGSFQKAIAYNNGTWKNAQIGSTISLNVPHLISATLDSTNLKVYLDGKFEASAAGGVPTLRSQFYIGNDSSETRSEPFVLIAFRTHNYAQNADEIAALFSNWDSIYRPRTQRIFIQLGGTKTATFVLNDKDSAAVANATGIRAAWFDQIPGSSMSAPTDVSAIETSDGSGNHTINIPNSTLTSGQTGYYAISNSDGTIATNHLQGGGPAKVD